MADFLVPYAGQVRRTDKPGSFENRCDRAYFRFSTQKMNTARIALVMKVSEATALKYVTIGRCRAKGLPFPYTVKEA